MINFSPLQQLKKLPNDVIAETIHGLSLSRTNSIYSRSSLRQFLIKHIVTCDQPRSMNVEDGHSNLKKSLIAQVWQLHVLAKNSISKYFP